MYVYIYMSITIFSWHLLFPWHGSNGHQPGEPTASELMGGYRQRVTLARVPGKLPWTQEDSWQGSNLSSTCVHMITDTNLYFSPCPPQNPALGHGRVDPEVGSQALAGPGSQVSFSASRALTVLRGASKNPIGEGGTLLGPCSWFPTFPSCD